MLCSRARSCDLKLQDLLLWALSLNPGSLSTQLRDPGAIHYPFPQDLRRGSLPGGSGWSGLGALWRRLALARSAACCSRTDARPPRPDAGGRSRLGVGQPVLATIETAPALRSRRPFLGSQRREVCGEGHWWDRGEAQVRLQSFHIRLSLQREAPCRRALGQLRNHPWKQSRLPAVC